MVSWQALPSHASCSTTFQHRFPPTVPARPPLPRAHRSEQTARATKRRAMRYFKIESGAALFCALVINIFVISVFAHGFGNGGESGAIPGAVAGEG